MTKHNRLTFANFNIADWFSFYRIAAAPVLLIFLFLEDRMWFSILLVVSYSTDAIDGFLARRLKITSPRGSQLDSMGDQVTFVLGVVAIFIFEYTFILTHWLWIVIAFGLYGLQMLLAWRKYGKATAFHTYLAKLSAITQAIFILWLLFFTPLAWLFYTMIAIGILETLEEITLIFLYDHWKSDVRGLYWGLKDKKRRKFAHNHSHVV